MADRTAIVIGAGIVGLATARAVAEKGYRVKVFDRSGKAVGASIRNFGMVWPIGQPDGKLFNRAIRSREIWKEVASQAGIWFDPVGSLHLAYAQDERNVLEEFYSLTKGSRKLKLLDAKQTLQLSHAVAETNLQGSLYCEEEIIVDPRQAICNLPGFLSEKYGVEFYWSSCVSFVADNTVYIGNKEEHEADLIFICSGSDFETLYPEEYAALPLTKCKLQMMRLASQPNNWRIGPAICGALSLIHYKSFTVAPSLRILKQRFEHEMPEYLKWGIHVMVSQNQNGELTVGDSHEYGITPEPFDKDFINDMILQYLKTFACFRDDKVIESWNGVYAKLTNGETDIFLSPAPGVFILNGLGGAGMTLSFGFAEEAVDQLIS